MDNDMRHQVEDYQRAVLKYEQLQSEVNALLNAHGGSEQMSAETLLHYRALARQRDEALNEIRWMESLLLDEDTHP
jgi:hypothetical protein